jgi:carbonic anhydrase
MSLIDKALTANRHYAKKPDPKLRERPTPRLAVVTCMDPRLSDLPAILGLPHSDLDVIRTAGPAVTDDVLGELVASNRIIGTTEIMLLNHTGCGFTTFTDEELNKKLAQATRDPSPAPMRFFSYKDPEQHTRDQIEKVRSHPWIEVPVRGFVLNSRKSTLSRSRARPEGRFWNAAQAYLPGIGRTRANLIRRNAEASRDVGVQDKRKSSELWTTSRPVLVMQHPQDALAANLDLQHPHLDDVARFSPSRVDP